MTQSTNNELAELASKILRELPKVEGRTRMRALQLAAGSAVTILDGKELGLPPTVIPYHVDRERLADPHLTDSCRLFSSTMPLSNGVVVGHDQVGLRCSHPTCGRTVCPFALAACYLLANEGASTSAGQVGESPVEEQGAPASAAGEAKRQQAPQPAPSRDTTAVDARNTFQNKWLPRLEGSRAALNLLLSDHENDFAGALVVDDDSYLDEFLSDLTALLAATGKVGEGVKRVHALELALSVDAKRGLFGASMTEDLPTGYLHVIDRLSDLKVTDSNTLMEAQRDFLIERLGHIVDDRYVVLLGSQREVSDFLGANRTLAMTYGAYTLTLKGMSSADVLAAYLDYLDDNLVAQVDEDFRRRLVAYVEFNRDVLPFKGRELADYLAKESNAAGRLVLPKSRFQASSLEGMLDGIIGLEQVKATVRQLAEEAQYRKRMENSGHSLPHANMHMLFMGNPGTGKTMVARLVSSMLYKIGICRLNKFVEVTSKDLVAKYVGHTDKRTHEVIESALGGVLFIDEAYALASDAEGAGGSFGKEALAELVKSMEDHKDDLIVILAGYEKEMQRLVDVNPGLSSRIGYTFHFADYTTSELLDIFRLKATRSGFALSPGVDDALVELFDYFRRFRSFGNGRFVDKVLQKAITNHAHRLANEDGPDGAELMTLAPDEVPDRREMFGVLSWKQRSADEMLAPLVGLKEVKEQVRAIERVTAFRELAARSHLALPAQNLNMVFTGNPGTGKTTVARIVGKVLYAVGAVPTNRFVEVQAKDLVSPLSGKAGEKVTKVVEGALGGVLFLDEAYALTSGGGGDEALAALVKEMSDHRDELVVIFAGYTAEMRAFLDYNPGLSSRIGYQLEFEDYKPEELNQIFERKLTDAGFELGEGVLEESLKVMKFFHSVEDFGNGRFVDRVVQETIAKHSGSYTPQTLRVIGRDDVPSAKELARVSATSTYDPTDMTDERDVLRVAKHEAGHAVCRLAETGETDILLITIEQEGNGALGYVEHKAGSKALPTSADLRAELVCLMGGMAAEELAFGQYSAGNSSDLEQATRLAARYVATYGMSECGMVQFLAPTARLGGSGSRLEALPLPVINEMNRLLNDAFERAKRCISSNQARYDNVVDMLMRERSMTGDRLMQVWGTPGVPNEAEGD